MLIIMLHVYYNLLLSVKKVTACLCMRKHNEQFEKKD